MPQLGPSPLAAGDGSLSVAEARAAIAAALRPIADTETVALAQALGRVLAGNLISPIDVPAPDNAAMGGYAFASAALRVDGTSALRSIGSVHAGTPYTGPVAPGECLAIMTGAAIPASLDTVVPHELCRVEGDMVHFEPGVVRAGENRRRRSEDLATPGGQGCWRVV